MPRSIGFFPGTCMYTRLDAAGIAALMVWSRPLPAGCFTFYGFWGVLRAVIDRVRPSELC